MPKPKASPVSKEAKDLAARAGERLIAALKDIDEAFAVEGVHETSVNIKDVGYRKKPLLPNSEHFLNEFYVGARGQIILKAFPVESPVYEWAEVDETKMDYIFPLVGASLARHLKVEDCEDFASLVGVIKQQIVVADEAEAALARDAKAQANLSYTQLPNYGRF